MPHTERCFGPEGCTTPRHNSEEPSSVQPEDIVRDNERMKTALKSLLDLCPTASISLYQARGIIEIGLYGKVIQR